MHKVYKSVAEQFMPTLTSTKFLAEGKLTIEEFISAGDNLVGKCPTWQWSGCEEGARD